MPFHAITPRAHRGKPKRTIEVLPDPYSPTSEGFADRNRQTRRRTPSGATRVDIGEPVKGLPDHR